MIHCPRCDDFRWRVVRTWHPDRGFDLRTGKRGVRDENTVCRRKECKDCGYRVTFVEHRAKHGPLPKRSYDACKGTVCRQKRKGGQKAPSWVSEFSRAVRTPPSEDPEPHGRS